MALRLLTAAEVERCLPMADAIAAVAGAFVAVTRGRLAMPTRLQLETASGVSLFMPVNEREQGTAVKVVSVHPDNPRRGLAAVTGVVLVLDADTGVPTALMDAAELTGRRTGAASGVATELLARPDARLLGLVGAGAQARYQALAVAAVRPIERVRVWNRTRERAEALAERLSADLEEATLEVAGSPAGAVAEADVVCTATSAQQPLLSADDLPAGVHVNAVGSFRPDMAEIDPAALGRARVVVDQRAAALEEAGEVIQAVDAGIVSAEDLVEIGAVLDGDQAGRGDEQEVTLFKSCGLAAQDLYAAVRVLEAADRREQGAVVEL